MSKRLKIGTEAWFRGEQRWGIRGTVHACLQLLAQGAISVKKCLELVHTAIEYTDFQAGAHAPWDELEWGNDGSDKLRDSIAANIENLGCNCRGPHKQWCALGIASAIREGRL